MLHSAAISSLRSPSTSSGPPTRCSSVTTGLGSPKRRRSVAFVRAVVSETILPIAGGGRADWEPLLPDSYEPLAGRACLVWTTSMGLTMPSALRGGETPAACQIAASESRDGQRAAWEART